MFWPISSMILDMKINAKSCKTKGCRLSSSCSLWKEDGESRLDVLKYECFKPNRYTGKFDDQAICELSNLVAGKSPTGK